MYAPLLWKAYPLFGIVDRIYLYSGLGGVALLFVDWRIGLAVLLIAVPLLYTAKQAMLRRILDRELGGGWS